MNWLELTVLGSATTDDLEIREEGVGLQTHPSVPFLGLFLSQFESMTWARGSCDEGENQDVLTSSLEGASAGCREGKRVLGQANQASQGDTTLGAPIVSRPTKIS
jgi:hypothetical protein